ncbi:aldo/keto reductase [Acinetobacter baumannii]|uniref:aldo/keto reductase n=1 Tax=Acinetobacter baumannii TaxID=470 RepID=UPI003AF575FD
MSTVIFIQARTNSSRLPGKSLLTINGLPLVVLSAKRAGNTGKKVVVLTSNEASDDELYQVVTSNQIECFRGDLNDVLKRFNDALADYEDETIVVRLTADNILPDGELMDDLELQFLESGARYMVCSSPDSNVPYGISAEIFYAKEIREAHLKATSDFEREHVTPFIRKSYSNNIFYYKNKEFKGYSNFRVTIDTFDDYLSMHQMLSKVDDIINIKQSELVPLLLNLKFRPYYERSAKPMTLGGAQFGLNYGVTNSNGKITKEEANKIIKQAITEGVQYIDTASAYGDSEIIIGEILRGGWKDRVKVITKLDPLNELSNSQNVEAIKYAVQASVFKSCRNLGVPKLDILMLHRANHLVENNKLIYEEIITLKNNGLIDELGVSVQSAEEMELALGFEEITFIQFPFNILDNRWDSLIERIKLEKSKRKLILHARSVLLQGLLTSQEVNLWEKAHIENGEEIYKWLDCQYKINEKMSISDLCISYVNSQAWIDSVVIGVTSYNELLSNLQSVSMKLLTEKQIELINQNKPTLSEKSLNPALWSK